MKSTNLFSYKNILLLTIAFVSGLLMSPKWTVAIATWIHYTVLLRFYRDNNYKGFLLSIPVLAGSSILAQLEVIPMGLMPISIMLLIGSVVGLLPYIVDKFVHSRLPTWATTLIFPSFHTAFCYFMDKGPQGTWSNMAYTQYDYLMLMQITSVVGIYGINFLIFWFASFGNYCYEKWRQNQPIAIVSLIMPFTLLIVLAFGINQLNTTPKTINKATMATITLDNTAPMEAMYQSETGKVIEIPVGLSQSDPILVEIQKGMLAFMANPTSDRFAPVYRQLDKVLEKYSLATKEAAEKGAKIVTWSEAAILNVKSREKDYEKKVALLADELDMYLFFPTAVFHPEKVGKERVFIENKVLTFDPEGNLVNTYFKNIPIMGVEPSFPGDGTIPVIETPFGNLSPIICYDADHPQLIAQISKQNTDMLVVPTGDWKAISPYHTYMAAVRCIENGVSMIKSTSNGMSAFVDDKGRILASYDYFDEASVKMIIQEMPVQSSDTLYAVTAPMFILANFLLSGLFLLWAIIRFFVNRMKSVVPNKKELAPA